MRFRSFSLRRFLLYLSSALLYPVWVWISSPEGQRLLKLTDALTVMGLVFLILAVLFSLIRHGDFDIMEYVALRSLRKGDVKSFDAFREDKKEKRKDSMNYPFWTCVLLFLVAGFITLFVY